MNCKPPTALWSKSSNSTSPRLEEGQLPEGKTEQPSVNIIGISSLGFHNHHDCTELKRLMADLGIEVNEVIPEGASVHNLKNLPRAWFNLVPYREIGLMAARYLEQEFGTPMWTYTDGCCGNSALHPQDSAGAECSRSQC
jgi:light-independent protochlorophyllide reductase B subunit